MRAEVISIGDEITTGQRLDTNSQWLSQQLTLLGCEVAFHTTVGDELEDNIAVLCVAIERVEVVVITGGLGPTADDLTREAIAAATGTTLVRDAASLAHIEHLYASRGREMPERNQVQADFPEGSRPIPNFHGTAPGVEMLVPRTGREPCALFALPGVPVEMHEMWSHTVAERISQLQHELTVIRHRRIKCFGLGESQLEAMLPDLIRRGREPKVGITVSDATITLRITATADREEHCYALMEPTIEVIRQSLGIVVFGEEDDELEHVVLRLLKERGKTLAVAEWATAGRISEWLTAVDQHANHFVGGMTIRDRAELDSLVESTNVAADAEDCDATVACAMAEEVRHRLRADYGLAVAAYPTDPYQADSHVCVALASAERTHKWRFGCASHPAILQARSAKQALNALRLELLKDARDDAS
ncbi:CinA family nicotinamide mononucleotide deamidase-related protein [Bythopirellula polymerisocia]|uniref:CinA-like protein n=1 Tax=Bythopirellula polymerisocia TaxID=2528003 RepID=A0A5C6CUF3_9BACT|nr:CinA family nicotinamide mononucleotide deamidase-related protein [Bythopirellula polymerisocia]TWU28152.1 putative competence-damage inducible protein [Bythopirellula polymerisocia]